MTAPSSFPPGSPELPNPEPGGWLAGFPPVVVVVLDIALRVVGGLLAVAGAVLTATLEVLFATVRVGGYPIGVSVVLAVLANVALGWFAYQTVGRRAAVALPAVAWFTLMVVAAGGTTEGDILLAGNNWVGVVMIFAGSLAFAVVGYQLMMAPRPRPVAGS